MTAPRYYVLNLDQVPEPLRQHYREVEDGFELDIEGGEFVRKARVDELREANIAASVEVEQLRSKVRGRHRELEAKLESLEAAQEAQEKGPGTAGPADSNPEVPPSESESATEGSSDQEGKLAWLRFEDQVRSVALDHGARRGSLADVVNRLRASYRQVDGEPVPHGADGSVIYGSSGVDPMRLEDVIGMIKGDAPHLFDGNAN